MPEMMGELSLDDQIAIATAQVHMEPSEKRLCRNELCGVPLANANKGEYCFRHSQIEQALKYEKSCNKTEVAPDDVAHVCKVMNCDTPVASYSASGRCSRHTHLARGMQLKDGSIPRPFKRHELPIVEKVHTGERVDVFSSTGELRGTVEKSELLIKRTPVTEEEESIERLCAVFGCATALASYNKSGRCGFHAYIKKGMRMKDGTIPRSHGSAVFVQEGPDPTDKEIDEAQSRLDEGIVRAIQGIIGERDFPVQVVPAVPLPAEPNPEFVSMKVPTEALDRFWARMTVDDKLRIIEREIFGS